MQQHGSKYYARRPPPPPDPGSHKVKIQVVQDRVMLQIQLKTIANAVIWKQIFCPQPPLPDPVGQKVKFNFGRTWSCCISIQRESQMQQYNSKYFAHSPPPLNRSKFNFFISWSCCISKGIVNAATW